MRVFEETVQEGRKVDRRVLYEMSYKEVKLLVEMCEEAIKVNKRKSAYKTMLAKLEEAPVWSFGELTKKKK